MTIGVRFLVKSDSVLLAEHFPEIVAAVVTGFFSKQFSGCVFRCGHSPSPARDAGASCGARVQMCEGRVHVKFSLPVDVRRIACGR
jgi:hypothetical protein